MNYYARKDTQGNITAVEGYSHDEPVAGAEPITPGEYKAFIDSLPVPVPEKPRITRLIELLEAKGIILPGELD